MPHKNYLQFFNVYRIDWWVGLISFISQIRHHLNRPNLQHVCSHFNCTSDLVLHSVPPCQTSIPLHYAEWDTFMEYLLPMNFLVFVQVPSPSVVAMRPASDTEVPGIWTSICCKWKQHNGCPVLAVGSTPSRTIHCLSHPCPAKLIVNWSGALGPAR